MSAEPIVQDARMETKRRMPSAWCLTTTIIVLSALPAFDAGARSMARVAAPVDDPSTDPPHAGGIGPFAATKKPEGPPNPPPPPKPEHPSDRLIDTIIAKLQSKPLRSDHVCVPLRPVAEKLSKGPNAESRRDEANAILRAARVVDAPGLSLLVAFCTREDPTKVFAAARARADSGAGPMDIGAADQPIVLGGLGSAPSIASASKNLADRALRALADAAVRRAKREALAWVLDRTVAQLCGDERLREYWTHATCRALGKTEKVGGRSAWSPASEGETLTLALFRAAVVEDVRALPSSILASRLGHGEADAAAEIEERKAIAPISLGKDPLERLALLGERLEPELKRTTTSHAGVGAILRLDEDVFDVLVTAQVLGKARRDGEPPVDPACTGSAVECKLRIVADAHDGYVAALSRLGPSFREVGEGDVEELALRSEDDTLHRACWLEVPQQAILFRRALADELGTKVDEPAHHLEEIDRFALAAALVRSRGCWRLFGSGVDPDGKGVTARDDPYAPVERISSFLRIHASLAEPAAALSGHWYDARQALHELEIAYARFEKAVDSGAGGGGAEDEDDESEHEADEDEADDNEKKGKGKKDESEKDDQEKSRGDDDGGKKASREAQLDAVAEASIETLIVGLELAHAGLSLEAQTAEDARVLGQPVIHSNGWRARTRDLAKDIEEVIDDDDLVEALGAAIRGKLAESTAAALRCSSLPEGEKDEAAIAKLRRVIGPAVTVATTAKSKDLAGALLRDGVPLGGWRLKHRPRSFTVAIGSFIGSWVAGPEWRWGQYGVTRERLDTHAQYLALAMPIGLELGWSGEKGRTAGGVLIPVVDPAAYLLWDPEKTRLPGASPLTALSPGLVFWIAPVRSPIVLMLGPIFRPRFRTWQAGVNEPGANVLHLAFGVAADATFWTFVNRDVRKKGGTGS